MLTVYGTRPSRTFRVLWALEEMGLDYTFAKTMPQSEEMFAVNPLGQAPALRDGGTLLTDSIAILHYLTDRQGALTYPPGTVERAQMDARLNFILTEVDAAVWLMGRHGFVLPKEHRMPGMRAVAEADLGRVETKFVKLLGGAEYFGGSDFTIADIVAGYTWNWAESAKVELHEPVLKDYLAAMKARPAWSRAEGSQP